MSFRQFSLAGEFLDGELEAAYREAAWPAVIRRVGVICALSGLVFLSAGLGTALDLGYTPEVYFLLSFRSLVALMGLVCLLKSRWRTNLRHYTIYFFCFIMLIGVFESVEAVLTYTPALEFNTPFTLLILLLFFLVAPLSFKPLLLAGLITAVLYVGGLRLFVLPSFSRLVQLTSFFLAANVLGSYVFIQLAQSGRKQFLAVRRIEALNRRLREEVKAKEEANRRLELLAQTDPLTHVANRRKFMNVMTEEYQRFRRYRTAFSLLLLDIDFFKKINDDYGHDCGDLALKEVTRRVEDCLRETDTLARIGGEEFAVILPETKISDAMKIAERIREEISARGFSIGEAEIKVTVSIGAAESKAIQNNAVDTLVKHADLALFDAKNRGRNRSVEFDRNRCDN